MKQNLKGKLLFRCTNNVFTFDFYSSKRQQQIVRKVNKCAFRYYYFCILFDADVAVRYGLVKSYVFGR